MLCYRLFKLLLKNSIWHAHFFSPNNKRAIKHNSWCTWTAHRYLTTSQTCQKHATYCFRAGLCAHHLEISHNRKWYLHDGLISQSSQHLFHTNAWKKTAIIQLIVMSRTSIFISLFHIRFSDMWSSQYSFTQIN